MNWLFEIQKAINYIEDNLTEKINYENLAKRSYSSTFHFQRVFGITCGVTIGEYIRNRRLTLAGLELLQSKVKVIDLAFKYGYDTPESFSRAFYKFHGVTPSKVKKSSKLNSFSRIEINSCVLGGNEMTYKIESKPELVLVGYKKRFKGAPYGSDRYKQEEEFLTTTRAKQWLLIGASCNYSIDYMVITNVNDDGYDFYVAYELDEWTRKELFNPLVTGVDFIDKLGFEIIVVPSKTYAIFETEKKKRPIADYTDLRSKLVTDWLPTSNFNIENSPEVTLMHWRPNGKWENERYIEIRIPIENTK